MNYRIVREKRRTLALRVDENCNVIAYAPMRLPEKEINKFIISKTGWIEKCKQKITEENAKINSLKQFNTVMILGQNHEIIKSEHIKKIIFQDDVFIVPEHFEKARIEQSIKKTLVNLAKEYLAKRLEDYSKIMKLNYAGLKIVNAKTKWGSCAKNGAITLNWRLFMLKENLIDYVIVHELCHLLQFNHSQVFYKLIEAVIPDWKQDRLELKQYAYLLKLFR